MESINSKLSIFKNSFWNFFGQAAPFGVAIVVFPGLARNLGLERFGVLSLAWAMIGYVSLFDFGLGRALTQLVSVSLREENKQELSQLIWSGVFILAVTGGWALSLSPEDPAS